MMVNLQEVLAETLKFEIENISENGQLLEVHANLGEEFTFLNIIHKKVLGSKNLKQTITTMHHKWKTFLVGVIKTNLQYNNQIECEETRASYEKAYMQALDILRSN